MEKKQKSVKINMLLNGFLRVSSMIFPLVTFPYVSRILGATGMGKITFSNSIVAYFLIVAQLGIPTYGIRACSKVRDDKEKLSKTVYELMLIEIVLAIISILALLGTLFIIPKFKENASVISVLAISIILNAVGVEWLYQALEEYAYITWRSLTFKLISLILMFLMIHDSKDVELYALLTVIASSLSYICNVVNIRKFVYPIKKFSGDIHCKQHVMPALIFFAMTVATTIYTNLDNIMLGFMTTDADVGYYAAAVKVKTFLVSAITSIGVVLLPRATKAVEASDYKEFNGLLDMSLHVVVLVAIPLVSFFSVYAQPTIYLLSGREYEASVLPMQIILPTVLFIGITNVLGYQVLVPLNKEKWMLFTVTIGAFIDLVINLLLINELHCVGAAIGTVFAEIGVLLAQIIIIKRKYKHKIPIFKHYKVWMIGLIDLVIILIYKHLEINIYLSMFSGAIVFFGVYILLLIIVKDEIVYPILEKFLDKLHVGISDIKR